MPDISRRRVLGTGLATTAAAGLGITGAGTGWAASALPGPHQDRDFPPVPGMRGDRRANEFWWQYEVRFAFEATQEVRDAYAAIDRSVGGPGDGSRLFALHARYQQIRREGGFPDDYLSLVAPVKDAYAVLSRLQLELFDDHYGGRHQHLLPWAFVRMGDGTLYDPRMPGRNKLHLMPYGANGVMTHAWHLWHAVNRANTLLGLSPGRWNRIDPLIGLGWAVQSVMYPDPDLVNPPMATGTAQRLVRQWRWRTPARMDTAFDSHPHPPGHRP
ncbi:hypothetical protein ACIBCB_11830 [Streptomyces uncialis]|uniref:hypothetical protein n=1 Tax=Streptomyces uncialis TaxID=1048205 RepID=UPI002254AAB7|nr:hypothetical protein [Streptomyces uncialis]MCX4661897.1 hypothetical protein [Streptomyces uncialis]WTE09167.1 hypothetical protein OG924_01920 [Streptomyces uncialis]